MAKLLIKAGADVNAWNAFEVHIIVLLIVMGVKNDVIFLFFRKLHWKCAKKGSEVA